MKYGINRALIMIDKMRIAAHIRPCLTLVGGTKVWVILIGVIAGCVSGFADNTNVTAAPKNNGNAYGHNKQTLDTRAVVIPSSQADPASNEPERKGRPDRTQPNGDVKNLIKQFQAAREAYLQDQQILMKQLKGASAEDRAAIREQLKESLDQWREQQKELIKEQRDRAIELKRALQADLGRVVDDAQGEGRGR